MDQYLQHLRQWVARQDAYTKVAALCAAALAIYAFDKCMGKFAYYLLH